MSSKDDLAEIIYRVNNPHYGDYTTHEETAQAILHAGWLGPVEQDCKARVEAAQKIAKEMLEKLVSGPEREDVVRIIAALDGETDV
jgi:hypothetical protein